ncbi:MAG: hypothetical protein ACJAZS_000152 [Alteromonas naphthalenivorans]|jgi:hypothetical protein
MNTVQTAFNTGASVAVEFCQVCQSTDLDPILFLGYLPSVNTMRKQGSTPAQEASYPANLLFCKQCELVQLGLLVDPNILFPPEYPYTSSTTKILRDNFADLAQECNQLFTLKSEDLTIDIGSNDGNLLSNFKNKTKVLGITPEEIGKLAIERGIPTVIDFFNKETAARVKEEHGKAKIITATNVFAHMEDVNEILASIKDVLTDDGIFVSESHYLLPLIETLQYDTIYHEHLRYYSLKSLTYLLNKHGLEVIHAKAIPTHGGSIRVYAARPGNYSVQASVKEIQEKEQSLTLDRLKLFKKEVVKSRSKLYALISDIKNKDERIFGVGAPSRASTLITYTGLDDGILDCVVEIKGSHKVGKYIPGTLIPVVDEAKLFEDQPEYALLLSWHIADELITNLRNKGYKGKFIVPLPHPTII